MKTVLRRTGKIALVICLLMFSIQTFTYCQDADEIRPVTMRTDRVREAIVAAVPGINAAADVTEEHLAAITTLDLSGQGILSLVLGDFDGLTGLTKLDLGRNDLLFLQSNMFAGLSALEELNLAYSDFEALPEGIFDELTALRKIDLSGNKFTTLRSDVFEHNTDLTHIDLRDLNQSTLTTLPDGIFDNNTRLTHLDCYWGVLMTLPDGIFDNNINLQEVAFNHNKLTSLPDGIFDNNTSLQVINFRYNALMTLPDGIFDNNTNLQRIYFDSNKLTTLPDDIFDNNTNLQRIWFEDNKLTTLPDGIFVGLTQLKIVNLWRNDGDGPIGILTLPILLEVVENQAGQFKVKIPSGTPLNLTVSLTATNGTIANSVTSVTIPAGGSESDALTVTRTAGTMGAVTVDVGTLRYGPGSRIVGFYFVKSDSLPLEIFEAAAGAAAPPLVNDNNAAPNATQLLANFPNPFNPETWIPYHLAMPSNVSISIYDAHGRIVRDLHLGHQQQGYYTTQSKAAYWDGRNNIVEPVASGVYFYQLQTDHASVMRKMLILK